MNLSYDRALKDPTFEDENRNIARNHAPILTISEKYFLEYTSAYECYYIYKISAYESQFKK